MHPTFMRGNLIVSEIEVQVARDPELNPGNHTYIGARAAGRRPAGARGSKEKVRIIDPRTKPSYRSQLVFGKL